jgi:hypothetical protein
MARITYVKHAQQRYATVPVIDPETGQQKRTPVMRNGRQKVTKRGMPVFMDVTVADKTRPLPNLTCGKCRKEILPGDPYKHISPRSGPYGGRKLIRCGACPNWHVWEYSSSLSARVAQIQHDAWDSFDGTTFESNDDVESWLQDVASQVRELAEEKEEGASNIEDGFGHETYQSAELREASENLNSWADEIEGVSLPDFPEAEEVDCDECSGGGQVENEEHTRLVDQLDMFTAQFRTLVKKWAEPGPTQWDPDLKAEIQTCKANIRETQADLDDQEEEIDCVTCDGSGQVEGDEPSEEQVSAWQDEVRDVISVIDESPV